eukprot:6638651-Prymnesium_polylepis.1
MGPDQDPRDAKRVTGAYNQLSNLARLTRASRAAYPPSQRGVSLPSGAGPQAPARWECQAILAGAGS